MNRYLFLLLFAFTMVSGSMAADFTAKEKAIIYTNAVNVLRDYETVMNLMGEYVVNDIEKARSSAESFLELFVNRQVLIYNDLDPARQQTRETSEFYEAETYINSTILWYPDGIRISLDFTNARVSEIMTHSENVYSIDILVKKSIDGNYRNQTLNKNVEELTFRIAFNLENKALGKFRIVGIRSASSAYNIDFARALQEVNSEDFNAEDLVKIHSEIKTILKDYTMYLGLLGDPQETAEDKEFYKGSFLKLFPADGRVYNDISPEPQTNLVAITDYLANYIADYPKGIKNLSINADSLKFGQVMKSDTGSSYYTYTDANKFFSGSYKGKDAFSNMFPLIFKISFNAAGKTFSNFIISGIDKSEAIFFEAAAGTAETARPDLIIRPVTRKGFGMSMTASFGISSINDKDIKSLTDSKNLHSWDVSPLFGFISALGVSYYFNDNIAVRSGLEYNRYASRFLLSGKFTDNVLSADVNADTYYMKVDAVYDSLVTINYITFPLLANYTSGKPGKLGFYAEGGFKISFPLKATYRDTGYYKFYGYYPTEPAVLQIKEGNDWNILGFYTRDPIDKTNDLKIKGFNLALYVSAGINIPLGYYSSVTVGPEIILGISDIMSDKKTYTDIFGKTYNHQPTKIKNFGLRVSLAYKL
jgi:hypothetical protein